MAEAGSSKPTGDVIIIEDDPDDFPEAGPQNQAEAHEYMDKLDMIFSHMDDLLTNDRKDMLQVMVAALKKTMAKHWCQMVEANVDLVLRAVHDPACMYLHQHLIPEGANVMEQMTDISIAWEFLHQLPEQKHKQEMRELIMAAFDNLSEAHAHMSSYAMNMSSLAKIADPGTFDAVLKATARPLIQINIPERFLSSVSEPKLKMTAKERLLKLEKVLLPRPDATCLKREPKNGCTRLLAAAVSLCLKWKYFNAGTAKEACKNFDVQAKQLSKLLSRKKYLGGTTEAKKSEKMGLKEWLKCKKSVRAVSAIKGGEGEEEEEEEEGPIKKKKKKKKKKKAQ